MASCLDGRALAAEIEERIRTCIVAQEPLAGRPPGLAVLRVGDDPASGVYVANKERACARVGVRSLGSHLATPCTPGAVMALIERLNKDESVDGLLLQLPLPAGVDERPLLGAIDPSKDADGLHALNLGRLLKGEPGLRSCTPAGVMALLTRHDIELSGARAVVVGRSILVGKPMALMLEAANATVTVTHSCTRDLPSITRQADVLVVAAGRAGLIGAEHVRPGAVVVDVGIHRVPPKLEQGPGARGRLCGDVRYDEVEPLASAITPVPGGVGPMTVTMLLVNALLGWSRRCGLSDPLPSLLS